MIVLLVHYMSAFDWMWQMIHCKSFNQLSARCHSFSWLFFFTFLAGSTETSATFWSNTVLSIKMVMKLIWAAAFCELVKSSGFVGDFKANFSSGLFLWWFRFFPEIRDSEDLISDKTLLLPQQHILNITHSKSHLQKPFTKKHNKTIRFLPDKWSRLLRSIWLLWLCVEGHKLPLARAMCRKSH